MHARRSGGDRLDIVDALRGLQNRVDQNGTLESVARFEQRQILVDEMNVPVAFDLGDHHHVKLVADLADEPGHIIDEPGRIERVDARPQARRAEVGRLRHRDQAVPGRLLGVDRNRVLEIAEDDVDLADQLGRLRAHLVIVRRHEMDHALEARRKVEQRAGSPDRQRIEITTRSLHERGFCPDGDRRRGHRAISLPPQFACLKKSATGSRAKTLSAAVKLFEVPPQRGH